MREAEAAISVNIIKIYHIIGAMRKDTRDQSQINLLTSLVRDKLGIRLCEMEYDI